MKRNKRILVGKAVRKRGQPEVTHEEVAQAIRSFKAKGGLIRQLPPQPSDQRPLVGKLRDAAYESVLER